MQCVFHPISFTNYRDCKIQVKINNDLNRFLIREILERNVLGRLCVGYQSLVVPVMVEVTNLALAKSVDNLSR